MIQLFMSTAAVCYAGASLAYMADGKPWMGATMLFYCVSIFTIYMAGRA